MAFLVLMWSGPSWSHAHNRLTTLPSFTAGTVFRCPHIFPVAACLACPRSGREIQSPVSECTYNSLQVYITGKNSNNTNIHKILQGFKILAHFFISKNCPNQLAPNTSVRNTTYIHMYIATRQCFLPGRWSDSKVQNIIVWGPRGFDYTCRATLANNFTIA